MPEQRCPSQTRLQWHRGHERYIQSQSSMSLEQETFGQQTVGQLNCAATIRGKVNYRAAMRIIGRLIRLLRRDHKSVSQSVGPVSPAQSAGALCT